jgi:hypothetical protein
MISNFKQNNPNGLSIFMSSEKGEQLTFMDSNKTVKTITESKEIENTKSSSEYDELRSFYESLPELYLRMVQGN